MLEELALALAAIAVAVKLFQDRVPSFVFRALLILGVFVPFAALAIAIGMLWSELIGWLMSASGPKISSDRACRWVSLMKCEAWTYVVFG